MKFRLRFVATQEVERDTDQYTDLPPEGPKTPEECRQIEEQLPRTLDETFLHDDGYDFEVEVVG